MRKKNKFVDFVLFISFLGLLFSLKYLLGFSEIDIENIGRIKHYKSLEFVSSKEEATGDLVSNGYSKSDFSLISQYTKNIILKTNQIRQQNLHADRLKIELNSAQQKEVLADLESLFELELKTKNLDRKLEAQRIYGIDFLGEALIGRIDLKSSSKNRAVGLVEKILELNYFEKDRIHKFEKPKLKSLLGDQIELFEFYTVYDKDLSLRKLARLPKARYQLAKVGVQNGLWKLGYSKEAQKDLFKNL